MQRRTFLSLLAIPAIAQLLQSCGDDSSIATTPTTANGSRRSSLRSESAHIAATPTDAVAAGTAINAFAADLYERLTNADPSANLVFSPASIAMALTMTAAGAKGPTLDEMSSVLHIEDPVAIHHSMNGLAGAFAALNMSQDNSTAGGDGISQVQLSIANSLWAQTGLTFQQAFLDLLAVEYDAGLELVDYTADPEAARTAINEWVAQATKDRIPELLGEGTITNDVRLTLVNAIYLKANWDTAFDKALTADEPFTTPGGEVTVHMMHTDRSLGYAAGDGWQAVELPYVFGGLSFTVLVGDATIPPAEEVFTALVGHQVQLGLPTFDIETSTSLATVLSAMGMATAFTDAADFTGMTTDEPLLIGDVIHQANITVNEEGTEAAAATAVTMAATSMPEPETPVVLTVDRPFTFWLRDRGTGAIVFMGRVNDPSATRG